MSVVQFGPEQKEWYYNSNDEISSSNQNAAEWRLRTPLTLVATRLVARRSRTLLPSTQASAHRRGMATSSASVFKIK